MVTTNEYKINLNTIDKAKEFCKDMNQFESEIVIYRDRYIINAKSIMGIFSIDIIEPITIVIYSDNKDEIQLFNKIVEKYLENKKCEIENDKSRYLYERINKKYFR